jgi:hypothetical protein
MRYHIFPFGLRSRLAGIALILFVGIARFGVLQMDPSPQWKPLNMPSQATPFLLSSVWVFYHRITHTLLAHCDEPLPAALIGSSRYLSLLCGSAGSGKDALGGYRRRGE